MERSELLDLRKIVFDEYKSRIQLGEFDANSKTIQVCLEALVKLTDHLLIEAKKKK